MRFRTQIHMLSGTAARWLALLVVMICGRAIIDVPTAHAGYSLGWFSTYGSSAASSGGGYVMSATTGQPCAGLLTASPYTLRSGFWMATSAPYIVAVEGGSPNDSPPALLLHPVVPNPFIDRALVRFDLPREAVVRLRVFDVAGRLRKSLVGGTLGAGRYQWSWDATGDDGRPVGPGVYLVLFDAGSTRITQRVVILR